MCLINNNNFEIKKAKLEDLEEISNLAKRIYLKYNSSLDTDEGINNILAFINYDNILMRTYIDGSLILKAKDIKKNIIIGFIEIRNYNHISLLFIDDEYFRLGVAKKLFEQVKDMMPSDKYSVNSSDYAIEFYKKLGFVAIYDDIKIENGVHFHPMIF
ncbi:GNAT family N-acetyltransferase [Brachyspira pilosicoli]|uniref:GNAT family N-acetyltransferase n=1 Tax=Brachyspira pilosicoli TaxID=52584 RepID=A0A5C8ETW7_BRAPL|nr:GNAT family N-acetyltransferase [Brachyspira pilosicoli]TXJ41447.1 GNAT family N-acetyltransferase [Brachyspira pilosicoli]